MTACARIFVKQKTVITSSIKLNINDILLIFRELEKNYQDIIFPFYIDLELSIHYITRRKMDFFEKTYHTTDNIYNEPKIEKVDGGYRMYSSILFNNFEIRNYETYLKVYDN